MGVLKRLKADFEESLSSLNSSDYLELKKIFSHFIRVAIEHNKFDKSSKPVKKWVKLHDSFKNIDEIKDTRVVKWTIK